MRAVLLFQSTHKVIKSERLLLQQGHAPKVIPVPKHISSECGMALEVAPESVDEIRRILLDAGIATEFVELS